MTTDVAGAVKAAKGGAVEFRVEKAGIIHAGVGKASFEADKLAENIKAFADAVSKAKPAGAKGTTFTRRDSSTMGPASRSILDDVGQRRPERSSIRSSTHRRDVPATCRRRPT